MRINSKIVKLLN